MRNVLILTSVFDASGLGVTPVEHNNAKVEIRPFKTVTRLADFELVIINYSDFAQDRPLRDRFEKQAIEALRNGSTICVLHYDEETPGNITVSNHYDADVTPHLDTKPVFKFLHDKAIRIRRTEQFNHSAKLHRAEFQTWFERWGSSKNLFEGASDRFHDVIATPEGSSKKLAFSIKIDRGLLVLMPFQRAVQNWNDFSAALHCLIDTMLTYLTKRSLELPVWAERPFFSEEEAIAAEKSRLESELEGANERLQPFIEAKKLMALSDYDLEAAVPKFIADHIGLKVLRDDKRQEDFWILTSEGEKAAICEVKGTVKGFKKLYTLSVLKHRAEQELESVPAVVFVNCNLQAGSWQGKTVSIPKPEAEFASNEGALIVRVEDLVRLWDLLRSNKLKPADIFAGITSSKGWLEVTATGEVKLWPEGKAVQFVGSNF